MIGSIWRPISDDRVALSAGQNLINTWKTNVGRSLAVRLGLSEKRCSVNQHSFNDIMSKRHTHGVTDSDTAPRCRIGLWGEPA